MTSCCFIHLCDISRIESRDEFLGRDLSLLPLRGFLGLRFLLGDHGPLLFLSLDLSVEGKVFKEVFLNLHMNQLLLKVTSTCMLSRRLNIFNIIAIMNKHGVLGFRSEEHTSELQSPRC
jgi:hypothetical protein